jgi:hypothetical protein
VVQRCWLLALKWHCSSNFFAGWPVANGGAREGATNLDARAPAKAGGTTSRAPALKEIVLRNHHECSQLLPPHPLIVAAVARSAARQLQFLTTGAGPGAGAVQLSVNERNRRP